MIIGCIAGAVSRAANDREKDLTLDRAIALAMERHPGLKAAGLDVTAAEGRLNQAGKLPNPNISLEAENIGGEGQYKQFESAEYTAQIEQLFELGGKRSKRTYAARLGKNLSASDLETVRLDIRAETARRFFDVLAAQERVALGLELVGIAEEFLNAVSGRVRSGKVSPTEETKATILLTLQEIALAQAQKRLDSARTMLCALWDDPVPGFARVTGDLQNIPGIPSIIRLAARLPKNPDIARWTIEVENRQAALLLEKANRIPDVTISGGVRRFSDTGEDAFVFGSSIPLPLFNQNQGLIREAAAYASKAEQERRKVISRITADLTAAYNAYSTALIEITGLRNDVLPKTRDVFEAAQFGYMQGKFMYLDVLDAQRGYFEAKGKYIEALATCHKAIVEIERLANDNFAGPANNKKEM